MLFEALRSNKRLRSNGFIFSERGRRDQGPNEMFVISASPIERDAAKFVLGLSALSQR